MRIVAGSFRGRRLDGPDWPGLRPTSDRLRETLFNVLAPYIDGARVLDGYAGTGAVGIEALSRGAAHVTFVDRDPRAVRLIDRNLARTGARERHVIIREDLASAVRRLGSARFDVVFLDPPYGASELMHALTIIAPLIEPDTLLVIEHATRDPAPERQGSLVRTRDVRSGDSSLAFYRRSGAS